MSTSKRSIIAPPEKNRRRSRTIMYVSIAIVVIAVILAVAFASRVPKTASVAPTASKIKVGDVAPEFTVSATNGQFDLKNALASGKPVFLEVFATWCPHCQRMTTVLRSVRKKFPESRLAMLSVTGSPYARNATPDNMLPESQQDVDAFERDFHVTWPSMFDPNLDVAKSWGLDGFPTIYIVNSKGIIVYSGSGEMQEKELESALRKAGA